MHSHAIEREAEKQHKVLQLKYAELTQWLENNTSHVDFFKVLSQRNEISVRMEVKKQQKAGRWNDPCHKVMTIYSLPPQSKI